MSGQMKVRRSWLVYLRRALTGMVGSIATSTGVISSMQPIQSAEPRESCTMVDHWIHNCVSSHKTCTKTKHGNKHNKQKSTELPTRILLVGRSSDQDLIY